MPDYTKEEPSEHFSSSDQLSMDNQQNHDLLDSADFVQDIEVYQHYEIARNDQQQNTKEKEESSSQNMFVDLRNKRQQEEPISNPKSFHSNTEH